MLRKRWPTTQSHHPQQALETNTGQCLRATHGCVKQSAQMRGRAISSSSQSSLSECRRCSPIGVALNRKVLFCPFRNAKRHVISEQTI